VGAVSADALKANQRQSTLTRQGMITPKSEVALIALTSSNLHLRHVEQLEIRPRLDRKEWFSRLLADAFPVAA
jgi:hypothetical protein